MAVPAEDRERQTSAPWQNVSNSGSTSLSHTFSGLTDGTNYQFKVRAVNATGTSATSDASDAAQPADETLTAGSVTHNAATLTIGNYSGSNWYYKANAAPHASCSSAVSGTSTNLTSLKGNTSYTYTAYSDSSCTTANELASASAFLTKPAKPATPTATTNVGTGSLQLASTLTGGSGALTRWEYTTDDGTNWTEVSATTNTLSHVVTGLTNGTSYTFKVRAVERHGHRPDLGRLDVGGAGCADPDGQHRGRRHRDPDHRQVHPGLVLQVHVATGGTCSTNAVTGTSKDLTGLDSNTDYTFKAYSDSTCATEQASEDLLTKPASRPSRARRPARAAASSR